MKALRIGSSREEINEKKAKSQPALPGIEEDVAAGIPATLSAAELGAILRESERQVQAPAGAGSSKNRGAPPAARIAGRGQEGPRNSALTRPGDQDTVAGRDSRNRSNTCYSGGPRRRGNERVHRCGLPDERRRSHANRRIDQVLCCHRCDAKGKAQSWAWGLDDVGPDALIQVVEGGRGVTTFRLGEV
jgi:hypothetical protein